MFCTNCGNNLGSSDNFCGECGKAIHPSSTFKSNPVEHKVTEPIYKEPVVERESYAPPVAPISRKPSEIKQQKKREELKAELKELLEKDTGREITESELNESEMWLRQYGELMWDLGLKEMERQKKLKENPKGFHLEGKGYSCFICGNSVSDEETWYDKHGIKCLVCQKAIDDKVIPATAASNKDSWYSVLDLEHSFFINRHGVRRLSKEGLLKSRIILGSSGRPHCQLFFIEDNKDALPPKELTKWPLVKFQKDGQDWYHSEPWFNFADPKEVLKAYKILDYLQTLKEHEVEKTAHDLSFQLARGASPILKVDYINKDETKSTNKDSDSTK